MSTPPAARTHASQLTLLRRALWWTSGRPELGPLLGALALTVAFQQLSDGKFLTFDQISAMTGFASGIGLVALGVAILMISGEFDLSVAQTYALIPIIMGVLTTRAGLPVSAALALALLIAACIGGLNGALVIFGQIPSFIATLGTLFVLTTASLELAGTNPPELSNVHSNVVDILGAPIPNAPFAAPFIWLIGLGLVLTAVIACTTYGNWTRAAGDRGGIAARAMGVPVNHVKMANFVLCAVLAGLAGCLEFASFGRAEVHAGDNYNLLAIVAAVIGATSLFGVRGTLVGTVIGAFILGALNSGLVLTGVDQQYYLGIIGMILLVAAMINARVEELQRGRQPRATATGG